MGHLTVALITFISFSAFQSLPDDKENNSFKLIKKTQIRDIGIPVKSVNWVRLFPGKNKSGQPFIYVTMGQQADNLFLLQINPDNGQCQQFISSVQSSNYPTAAFMSKTGVIYIGAAYAGHLLRFDPEKEILEDLGAINPGAVSFPCGIDEDEEGKIWIGSYPTADLTCYAPQTDEFIRYGPMDEVDMYNYPQVNSDGNVACLIRMTKPHVVVLNPETEEKKVVGPITVKGEDTISLRRGIDEKLYIISSKGNLVIKGMDAEPVDEVPPPLIKSSALPDGTTFKFTDVEEQVYQKLKVKKPGEEAKTFDLNYQASGSDIFYVHAGPDNMIYGSSVLPLHLFRYNPENNELVDLGRCSKASGEAYSMANLDGKIYISSYPAAMVSVYDPSRPYNYGTEKDSNPRDLGRIDDISYRPRSTITGPLDRVWLASIPDYGRWGGPLSYYDPETEEKKAYYRICGDASCYTLAHIPDQELIAVGTSISGGSGTQPKIRQAVLFLWDYRSEEKIWEGTLDRPVSIFNALVNMNNKIYGTVTGGGIPAEMFVFDIMKREFTELIRLPEGHPLDLGIQMGPDDKIYGFTSSTLYRLDPNSLEIEELISDKFSVAGPILGNNIYYAVGHILKSMQLFNRQE
ncbi:hypothetical protein GF312_02795 [Candidatus Poribacteria bacterium]|nr:hypothetical protein [Candidatus Poribacteria bacterium]